MSLIEKFKPLLNISNLSDKATTPKPTASPQNAPLPENTTKLNDLAYQGLMTRSFLNKTLNRLPVFPDDQKAPAPPSVSPNEALQKIEELPPPNYKGIPGGFPDEDRQSIYEGRVREYNNQRIAIAENTLRTATPPSREDYKSLPRGTAEMEYREAVSYYNQQMAELRTISREAKVGNLEINSEFKKLSPENKALLKSKMEANEANPNAVNTLAQLGESPGFNQLSAEEQAHLINLVGGTNEQLSVPARNELERILSNPNADKSNPETFRKFLKDQPGLQYVVSQSVKQGEFDSKRKPYTVTGPEEVRNYGFKSGNAAALKYEVEIDGKKIPVYLPKNPDPNRNYHSIEEVAKGLAALPKPSFERIDNVLVEPQQNPEDAYWAKQYNTPDFRSYMTAGASGDVNIYPMPKQDSNGNPLSLPSQGVLDGSLIHETGHILSGQEFGDTQWKAWETAMQKDGLSASVYAKNARGEDFSETLELYMRVKGTAQEAEIRAIMPERFAILDKLVGG